ncbi:MAG: FMN-binding protein [Dehalococcoidales bacterium]|nr:FMN-binding protein [Dehalococcoidales bacterium]
MSILVGLEDKSTIKNIYVVNHGENIGFWNILINKGYFGQFVQLNIEDTALICDGGQIDAVTGATLSSMSVVDIVREAALEKVKLIK